MRKPTLFEKILLAIGITILIIGYILIHNQVAIGGFGWSAVQSIFLWFLLLVLVIVAAVNENIKEELGQLINLQLKEVKLLRDDLNKKGKR